MTFIMMILAYALPLPLLYGCIHFHIFDAVQDPMTRIAYIGIASILPSALLMVLVLKRIVHFIIKLVVFAGILYGLHSAGFIGKTQAPPTVAQQSSR
jgi:hypothetical protein